MVAHNLIPYHCGQQADGDAKNGHIQFVHERLAQHRQLERARSFYEFMNMRRSVRFFSTECVDERVLLDCVRAAGTSPSGAHQQPWTFVVVLNPQRKMEIRRFVEAEERLNYERRMRKEWVNDVEHLVSDLHSVDNVEKPYLTDAPALILIFKKSYELDENQQRRTTHYPAHGVGIATGVLICALHNANLVTLTSTPMGSEKNIQNLLKRPPNEKLYLLLPVGYPASNATVPYRTDDGYRKPLQEICQVVR